MVSACVRRGAIDASVAAPWAGVRRTVLGALAAVALIAAAPAVAAVPAPFGPPSADDGAALLNAAKWTRDAQRGDGGLPINGFAARHRVNLWGALGLAAANVNARDLATSANGRTLFGLLRGFAAGGQFSDTADLALYLLAAHAVGFTAVRGEQDGAGARDVVAELLAAQLPGTSLDRGAFQSQPGSGAGDALSTAYGVIALRSLDPFDQSAATAALRWLTDHQNLDGSWAPIPGAPSDVETTATVREAFTAVGQDGSIAASRASSWIGVRQGLDGGWSRTGDDTTSDVPATAAVARALLAQGVNPNDANNSAGQSPMSFLRSAQDADGLVGRAPGIPADEPTQATAIAMLAFGGTGLLFGPIAGGGTDELPNQRPPAGLPSGPLLPTETSAPTASTPTAPAPAAPTSAPAIQAPATPSSSSTRGGVKRVKTRRDPGTHGDGRGTADAGSGSGAGGGGGGTGTSVGTGALTRGGGGGGVSPGPVSVAAPSAAGSGVPSPTGRTGGTRTRTKDSAPRSVRGTLIGRQSATEGARGSSVATPGAAGASAGHAPTPWWAIALALAIVAGIASGIRLDRRNPELAL
jgi:hypothetical protein